MKKLILLSIVIGLLAVGMLHSNGVFGMDEGTYILMKQNKEAKPQKPPVAQCPKTLMTESCLTCHTSPGFKLQEVDPFGHLVFPNRSTSIIGMGEKLFGTYFLQTINSEFIKEAFEYWHRHRINHAIIEIHSPGGSLFDGIRIIGIIDNWKKKGMIVETRVYGFAISAGFLIFTSGTKGHRMVSKHASLMWHEMISFAMFSVETPSDKEEASRVLRKLQDNANTYISDASNVEKETVDNEIRKKEWWMTGQEAVEKYGIADGYLD